MTPKENPMDPALERAVSEIRDEVIPDEVIDTAAARVWARLAGSARSSSGHAAEHIRSCADFQSLIPDFRAGRLPEARALLLQDHLHECVACRRLYEGKVVSMPSPAPHPKRLGSPTARWAVAAGVIVTGGLVVWYSIVQFGPHAGRARVEAVNGTLYAVSPAGLRVLNVGADLADGLEIRTARDSDATLVLGDGSRVEMRERSGFSTSQAASEITVHLDRGSIIVEAAKRHSGHFYVATADCRVSVTGTVFSVSAGVKGSRVSVLEGQVRVSHDHQEEVLDQGGQTSTGDTLAPVSVKDDFSWSRNPALIRQLAVLQHDLARIHLPRLRYSSRLLELLPASTVFFASIPNLAQYLGEAQAVFRRQAADSPELRSWLSGPGAAVEPVLEKLRAANEFLGDEIVIFGTPQTRAPVFLAEVKRDGFPQFLNKQGLPLAYATRPGLVVFSPSREALRTTLDSGFQQTAFYKRIVDAYSRGAGLLVCTDLAHLPPHPVATGARYLIAEQKQAGRQMETRVTLAFDGPRNGMASWLASPSPMGALDYISSDATFVAAFAFKQPRAVLEEASATFHLPQIDAHSGLAASLGGEVAVALDGPAFPVPSWRLVAEVYDPLRFQAALEQGVAQYNLEAPSHGGKPLRTGQETADGRTYYLLAASDPNPLTEAHYTFVNGYLIAAPTRALVLHALEAKTSGGGIARAPAFTALLPRDHYANFSAVVYQNLGTTLAPLAGLLGALEPRDGAPHPPLANLSNLKPFLIAAYGEPDRITLANSGEVPSMSLNNFLSGGVFGLAASGLDLGQFVGTSRAHSSSR